jgi:hypothetical protein
VACENEGDTFGVCVCVCVCAPLALRLHADVDGVEGMAYRMWKIVWTLLGTTAVLRYNSVCLC